MQRWMCLVSVMALGASACGSDEACDPVAQKGCDSGTVCEEVQDGEPSCFLPVVVRGNVFDLSDDSAIAGARVVALDINRAPVGTVAVSDTNGNYRLRVPSIRSSDGTPVGAELTLRADAATYQTFPSGIRQSLPVDTSSPVKEAEEWVVRSALTDIGLIPLEAGAGTASLHGHVEVPAGGRGVLVVAETSSGPSGLKGYTAIADRAGDYRIFNLPGASYTVTAYARGVNYDPADVTLADGGDAQVDLAINGQAAGTVSGTVQIVNAPGGSKTSVILAVESTFDDVLERGSVPPGLRAPDPGLAPDVTGAYTIEGVPAGRYVVLAAFENDGLVRDPDVSIGGTSTLHIAVMPGMTTTVGGFKVTEALPIYTPGAMGPEPVQDAPMLSWKDDSSEDEYHVEVFNALGELAWETTIAGQSGNDPEVLYGGPLEGGMYYQYRATSYKTGVPISRTEDLKGVFFVP